MWYSIGTNKAINCANCSGELNDLASQDHHSGICPICKEEVIWYDVGSNVVVQVLVKKAPPAFQHFISWSQKELDELEFLDLILSFEKLGKDIADKRSI